MGTPSGRPERVIFSYPALPEIKLCLAIVFGAMFYGIYCVFKASQEYEWTMGDYGVLSSLPFYGPVMKDNTSWEWASWSPFALRYLPVFLAHTVLFNLGSRFLPELYFTIAYTLLSMASCIYYFTPFLVAISIAQGTMMFAACHIYKRQLTIWISSLPLLYYMMHQTASTSDNPFLIYTFVSYSMLSYVSYCMDTLNGPVIKEYSTLPKSYLRMMFYTFYQPYLFSLIVLYADFERQLAERSKKTREWKASALFALRIAFWWAAVEVALHFLYYETILRRTDYAASLPKDTFFALGASLGVFFHLKYVVIFGLPSIFARFDNMDPLPGPICISRVTLFSKVWREFDRGLYQFFKQYIFVPICAPTFSLPRKVFGVLVSYSFVLLWHGVYHHNIVWISLNIVALLLEMSAKSLYTVDFVRQAREKTISDVNFRRILAPLHIVPFAFGLYSNIYFLGGSETGASFVRRIYDEETVTLRWPFFLLITLGYFYAHVCMEVDRLNEIRKKNEKQKLR
ncbi:unnamed protein product [Heligmosomoides polygyrus]|uniref:Protein-cysteine N-palmitoyltransferase HHAT n=1 Tax=Heligmosomoides polygyrus TaxID=6339 RepID=A0A3P8BBW3_HELPZ|nr:unnamed protein product [Heligmosomoides polygyrus]